MPLGLQDKAVRLGSVTVNDGAPDLPPISPNGIDPLLRELDLDDPGYQKEEKVMVLNGLITMVFTGPLWTPNNGPQWPPGTIKDYSLAQAKGRLESGN